MARRYDCNIPCYRSAVRPGIQCGSVWYFTVNSGHSNRLCCWNLRFLDYPPYAIEPWVCRQFVVYLERHKLFLPLQSAYRRGHSTKTAVLKIIFDALIAADRREVTLLVMLDQSAAFDTVDHSILIDRLRNSFGVSGLALS